MKSLMIVFAVLFCSVIAHAGAAATPLAGTLAALDGKQIALGNLTGKVVVVVNTASRCGFTKQYKELQALHKKYAAKGLVVLGFPCNQFGKQEPGSAAEIRAFCKKNYGVTFLMMSKIDVNGTNAPALYQYLTSSQAPIKDQGPVKWNFEKFLFGRDGQLLGRYRSGVKPDDPALVAAIEAALAAPAR